MTYFLHKNTETIIELPDDFVNRLIKDLEELAESKELLNAHERVDKILLEFAPDEIRDAWQKVTNVKIE